MSDAPQQNKRQVINNQAHIKLFIKGVVCPLPKNFSPETTFLQNFYSTSLTYYICMGLFRVGLGNALFITIRLLN